MKLTLLLLLLMPCCLSACANPQTYVGSTPAHALVREFLQISATDSIDFIRWKLETNADRFTLSAEYGLCKPGTPGFLNGQRVAFAGTIAKTGHYYYLQHQGKSISLLEVNTNLLHFADRGNHLLAGNGGYSYALNNIHPAAAIAANIRSEETVAQNPLVFEGRTPCQELSALLGLHKTTACDKMKWYLHFYTDSVTAAPAYFLMGGMGYRKETMAKGSWQIIPGPNGRIVYRLFFDKWATPLNLLKAGDNILFFMDANGRLFTGNEDFSYTLNRKKEAYPRSE